MPDSPPGRRGTGIPPGSGPLPGGAGASPLRLRAGTRFRTTAPDAAGRHRRNRRPRAASSQSRRYGRPGHRRNTRSGRSPSRRPAESRTGRRSAVRSPDAVSSTRPRSFPRAGRPRRSCPGSRRGSCCRRPLRALPRRRSNFFGNPPDGRRRDAVRAGRAQTPPRTPGTRTGNGEGRDSTTTAYQSRRVGPNIRPPTAHPFFDDGRAIRRRIGS